MVDFVSLFELQKSCCPLDICCHPFCLAIYSMYNFNANRKWHGEIDGTISELNGAGHLDLQWWRRRKFLKHLLVLTVKDENKIVMFCTIVCGLTWLFLRQYISCIFVFCLFYTLLNFLAACLFVLPLAFLFLAFFCLFLPIIRHWQNLCTLLNYWNHLMPICTTSVDTSICIPSCVFVSAASSPPEDAVGLLNNKQMDSCFLVSRWSKHHVSEQEREFKRIVFCLDLLMAWYI